MSDTRTATSEVVNALVGMCCILAAAWFGFVKGEYARAAFYGVFGLGCHCSVISIRLREIRSGE